jgi:hypothetical protein
MADAQIWISVVCILTAFDIRPGLDDKGVPMEIQEFQPGMIWSVLSPMADDTS